MSDNITFKSVNNVFITEDSVFIKIPRVTCEYLMEGFPCIGKYYCLCSLFILGVVQTYNKVKDFDTQIVTPYLAKTP